MRSPLLAACRGEPHCARARGAAFVVVARDLPSINVTSCLVLNLRPLEAFTDRRALVELATSLARRAHLRHGLR